ncbi:hypothetical protein KFL_012400020 [Klebsormidium nitens]|uniref:Uncharacterized protein n=1 Tax=Klebsormidium nitens TaxID=105231 RepID=A0A1Y1IVT3_KLENI|nr:hypothetical protein KFL_012400020 [Klebsormidium nitens]|eukprot:GAQ92996.1 hypothetical protein KFL_012400020 [Klebsormidium nitens]
MKVDKVQLGDLSSLSTAKLKQYHTLAYDVAGSGKKADYDAKDLSLNLRRDLDIFGYDHVCKSMQSAQADHPLAFSTRGKIPQEIKDPNRLTHLEHLAPVFQKPTGQPTFQAPSQSVSSVGSLC